MHLDKMNNVIVIISKNLRIKTLNLLNSLNLKLTTLITLNFKT